MFDMVQWLDSFHSLVWLALVLVFCQFILACGLLSIAYYLVSRDKLRRDLFSRQLHVFDGVQEIFTDFIIHEHVGANELRRFVSVTSEAPFILGRDVVDHLHEIRSRLIVLAVWSEVQDRDNLPVSERSKPDIAARWLKDHIDSETLQHLFAQDMAFFSSARKRRQASRSVAKTESNPHHPMHRPSSVTATSTV